VAGASATAVPRLKRRWPTEGNWPRWLLTWSKPAAVRAVRAAIVMPSMFVIAEQVIGNPQLALFAAFGSFATLVLVSFGGTARDKLVAHVALAVTASVLITVGTAVSASTALAAIVTVPATFAVFFAGVAGPNAAAGVTGALLAYVLPAATSGTIGEIPDRLGGWWLASVAGTIAVLVLPSPPVADKLGEAARRLTSALAAELEAVLGAAATETGLHACIDAKHDLLEQFDSTPYRPTGLALPDQALANGVELLEWSTLLILDCVRERDDLRDAAPVERELLSTTASVLRESGMLFAGGHAKPNLDALDASRMRSVRALRELSPGTDEYVARVQLSFHTHAIAATVLAIGADAMLSARLVGADWLSEAGSRWIADQPLGASQERGIARVRRYSTVASRHASLRSVWFINSLRGALALAVAVAVAGLANVQHGFWVVLGTLSVLRTSAASTGAIALWALLGTAVGFVIGAVLVVAIGSSSTALWVALPIAVLVAAYAPGTAPFAVGQAAFTVTIIVLFNILVPVGWKVGELRFEDVAIGCAVSVIVGALFWPRGVASVVGDDLADAYRSGAAYLKQAADWICGLRDERPDAAVASITAGLRLDEALRGLLADQGTKHLTKEELWRLVGGTQRLRLTAHAVSELPRECAQTADGTRAAVRQRVELLTTWYDKLATQLGKPMGPALSPLVAPLRDGSRAESTAYSRQALWLQEDLDHLVEHLDELVAPATRVAEVRRRTWWR
jgi:Fusaric acid resistance protein-like